MVKKIREIVKNIYWDWKWYWRENFVSLGIAISISVGLILLLNLVGLPKDCSLCQGIRYHAPCFVNLTTGEIAEMELYEPHPTLVAEIANYTPPGNWGILYGAGLRMDRNRGNWTVETRIPNNIGRMGFSKFCYFCRLRLLKVCCSQYAIVDLYNRECPEIYAITNGAEYRIRCYTIAVSRDNGFLITLKGNGSDDK